MIDALTSLAFSIYSGKGIYAILLGSGASRSAEIPTGWEVTMDLVRQVATIQKESCDPNPESWYVNKFEKSPDYSDLLEQLAKTSAERTTVLSSYFEPTQVDRENGWKLPTEAHKQIASLVAKGYIRVILTTNFDRLIEQALEAEGVVPTVISTTDAIRGAMPLQHATCTVLKVHGDYRDTRFKNTEEELSVYPEGLNRLLDRILDEYGILVCGWSATWDSALRQAFLRSPNRRFSTVWASKGEPSSLAQDLIKFRQANVINISSADDFFSELANKIEALERFHAPHPLSAELAISLTKRFLGKPEFRIDLMDFVSAEVESQMVKLNQDPFFNANQGTIQEYGDALIRIERSLNILLNILVTGILYDQHQYAEVWRKAVTRMLDIAATKRGTLLCGIGVYPASLLFYAEGIAACYIGDYRLLKLLFTSKTSIERDVRGEKTAVTNHVIALNALNGENLNTLAQTRLHVPASERVFSTLRGHFCSMLPDDVEFADAFDRFEYLLALSYIVNRDEGNWGPIGRFGYRNRYSGQHISLVLDAERLREGANWGPIAQGLFDDVTYKKANAEFREFFSHYNFF